MRQISRGFWAQGLGVHSVIQQAGTVHQDQPIHPLRMFSSKLQADPAAHGPSRDIRLLQVLAVKKLAQDIGLQGDRVIDVRLLRSSVAEKIERVDLITVLGEFGNYSQPVL